MVSGISLLHRQLEGCYKYSIDMDDFVFRIPRKLLLSLGTVVLICTLLYSVVTGDSKKGGEIYIKVMTIMVKPLVDRIDQKLNKISERIKS